MKTMIPQASDNSSEALPACLTRMRIRHTYDIDREITPHDVPAFADPRFLPCLTTVVTLISLSLVAFLHLASLVGPYW